MINTNFRDQIRILKEKKKVSTAQLSRAANIHHDTIYKYLRGESEMSAANLEKILDTLNSMEDANQQKGTKYGSIIIAKRYTN